MASGKATMPTMTPATTSEENWERLYDLRVVTDFGTSKSLSNSGREKKIGTATR
jgi:hypothetical protein